MEIYQVQFKDKSTIVVQAESYLEAITEALSVLPTTTKLTRNDVEAVWSLVWMN